MNVGGGGSKEAYIAVFVDGKQVFAQEQPYIHRLTRLGVLAAGDREGRDGCDQKQTAAALDEVVLDVVNHDLQAGRYAITGLDNERNPPRFSDGGDPREFNPNALQYYVR